VPDSGVIDGNRDGNVRSQRQAGTTTGSPTLLLNWDELAIRFNWKAKVGSSILPLTTTLRRCWAGTMCRRAPRIRFFDWPRCPARDRDSPPDVGWCAPVVRQL